MTPDLGSLLIALQHGDSFFPSGTIAFSAGLETLRGEQRIVDAEGVERFLCAQLSGRWGPGERPFLATAHEARADLDRVADHDRLLDAMTLSKELREGSRRAGAALLRVHAELGTLGAAEYRERIRTTGAPGHLAIVQGLNYGALGLGLEEALLVAAHGFSVGLIGAAVRLGLIGHLAAQRILVRLHPLMLAIIAEPVPAPEAAWGYLPEPEIATMRHEVAGGRLFAN
jgi:urease accessory protein